MSHTSQNHTRAVARVEELKERERQCCERLDSLNRMLARLSPSDHLFAAVIRGIAKWSREQIAVNDALWDALSEMNSTARPRGDGPRLVVVH